MKCLFKWAICLCFVYSHTNAQQILPVVPGDFADPSVIKAGNRYYAVGTSSEWAPHFPVFSSSDLLSWKQSGYLFRKAPEWTSSSFWAPEYYYHNNTYFIYYTARRKSDNVSCIGVATSKYPDRDFTDHGVIIETGKEAIDAFVFDDNGQLYITWKAYGLDKRPIELLGSKLSADGLHLEGESFSLLKDTDRIGLEGQSILRKDGYYYLFYSAGNCCGRDCDYNVRVARARSFQGPYELYSGNPVLTGNAEWKCTGHGTFVTANDGVYYLYHAYNRQSTVFTGRQGMLAKLTWNAGWPAFSAVSGNAVADIKDDFSGKTPADYWQWDFRHATPSVKQSGGNLHLSGSVTADNKTGVALTVRPFSQNYEMRTTVLNRNDAMKGLVIYGDAGAAVGVGVINDRVEYWVEKDGKRKVMTIQPVSGAVELRMRVGENIAISVKSGRGGAREFKPVERSEIDFLPPWDRSPRIGLLFNGKPSQEAVFGEFEVKFVNEKPAS